MVVVVVVAVVVVLVVVAVVGGCERMRREEALCGNRLLAGDGLPGAAPNRDGAAPADGRRRRGDGGDGRGEAVAAG